MNRHVLIGKAWPYGNGSLHFGHLAGLLGADVLARYFRLAGDRVLFVSGTDCHGTPISNRAFQDGKTPAEIAAFYHAEFTDHFQRLGFSHDRYAATMQPHHHAVAQWIFSTLHRHGHLVLHRTPHLFCAQCQRFLVDRYVEGRCPNCDAAAARGDQCDACGQTYEATELKTPQCKNCGHAATITEAEHLFLHLPAFATRLRAWAIQASPRWRANAQRTTFGWLDKAEGLKDRAVTRNIDWGIPIPLSGWDDRRIYVWFEAVIGYFSTSIAAAGGDLSGGEWEAWWRPDNNPLHYYVHGKDNIPFHTVIWPAMLMGLGNLALPTHIVSSEYLQLPSGQKFSKSSGYGATVPEFLALTENVPGLTVDSLRHFLTAQNPENKDSAFSWTELVHEHDSMLVNKFGNLVNRAMTMAERHCQGQVPAVAPTETVMTKCHDAFMAVGAALEQGSFRAASSHWLALVDKLNGYWNDQRPWDQVKTDFAAAQVTIATTLQGINALSVLVEPFMPAAAERLRTILGTAAGVVPRRWQLELLPAGWPLGRPEHLFSRIDRLALPADS